MAVLEYIEMVVLLFLYLIVNLMIKMLKIYLLIIVENHNKEVF